MNLSKIYEALDYYYEKSPLTLKPLLMAALAARGYLHVSNTQNRVKNALFSIELKSILGFDWVRLNPSLLETVNNRLEEGIMFANVEMELNETMASVYNYILNYDDHTVKDQQHREGLLDNHIHNKASVSAQQQYAGILLAEALLQRGQNALKKDFILLANHILELSKVQPKRPRLQVADTLYSLLGYDGKGLVYYPFSGAGLVAAKLDAGKKLYADGSPVDSDYVSALLVNFGSGGSNLHFTRRDSSEWINWIVPDYVVCTYLGYVGKQSAFDFCLSRCLETKGWKGRLAAMVSPRIIFDEQSPEFKAAIKRNWVDTIVVLPFGEVAVLVDASREDSKNATLRFYDCTNPLLVGRTIEDILSREEFSQILKVKNVTKKGYLRYLIAPEIHEQEGYEIVNMRDVVTPVPFQVHSLAKKPLQDRVLLTINRNIPYETLSPLDDRFVKQPIKTLHDPAYYLDSDCLIVNRCGSPEPELFYPFNGNAFFKDGYAFSFMQFDSEWIVEELRKDYAIRQLHPYGYDSMVAQPFTVEQFLDLKLYRKIDQSEFDDFEDGKDLELPQKTELHYDNLQYTILKTLGNGAFGTTYLSLEKNLSSGESRKVVLKEFFMRDECHREGLRIVLDDDANHEKYLHYRDKFKDEANLLMELGKDPSSHIMHVDYLFESEETKTYYYVMKPYPNGSLADMIIGDQVPPESIVVEYIVKPLCQALDVAHKHGVLHLDIKPDNILIDEDGYATLIDFGIAKQYDEGGSEKMREAVTGTIKFMAPEQRFGQLTSFGPEADIYALAGTLYTLFTHRYPLPLWENDGISLGEIRMNLEHVSSQARNAIVSGLQASANLRPASALDFLSLFYE